MLDGLAFLPVDRVPEGMQYLKEICPPSLQGLLDYFDSTYVSGAFRSVRNPQGVLRFRRQPPKFPPETWNVHQATLDGHHRTNNVCEAWNSGFCKLVGHKNPSLWNVLLCLQKDCSLMETVAHQYEFGQQAPKRMKKSSLLHQNRLLTLCRQHISGEKSTPEFLRAIGQCIRINK